MAILHKYIEFEVGDKVVADMRIDPEIYGSDGLVKGQVLMIVELVENLSADRYERDNDLVFEGIDGVFPNAFFYLHESTPIREEK